MNRRVRKVKVMKNNVCTGESGVPTQIHFIAGREPTQRKRLSLAHHEGGFRLIMLLRHFEQNIIRQPRVQQAHRRRVTGKRPFTER